MNHFMFEKLKESLQTQEDGFEELCKERISAGKWKNVQDAQEKMYNEIKAGGKKCRQDAHSFDEWNEYLK